MLIKHTKWYINYFKNNVTNFFFRFRRDTRELPVLWHQAFLVFVQRYKEEISHDQKDELFDVLRHHTHHKITAEVSEKFLELFYFNN